MAGPRKAAEPLSVLNATLRCVGRLNFPKHLERIVGLIRHRSRAGALGAAVLLAVVAADGLAQGTATAGERVSGAQLQTWLDQKFSYAGVHHPSQCVILNVASAGGRTLFIRCPDGWAEKLSGTARVVGDNYCTTFPIPNTPPGEDCVTWHAAGQGRFEQRKGNDLNTSVIVLPQGLTAGK